MSRCKNCLLSFAEENGWQEFCSIECARNYFTRDKRGAALIAARDAFEDWIANPQNARLVKLDGTPAEPPKIGKFVEKSFVRQVPRRQGKKVVIDLIREKRMVNVGSDIAVRPMTEDERKTADRQRGRGSFGQDMIDNQVWRDVPSLHGSYSQGWFPHDE